MLPFSLDFQTPKNRRKSDIISIRILKHLKTDQNLVRILKHLKTDQNLEKVPTPFPGVVGTEKISKVEIMRLADSFVVKFSDWLFYVFFKNPNVTTHIAPGSLHYFNPSHPRLVQATHGYFSQNFGLFNMTFRPCNLQVF